MNDIMNDINDIKPFPLHLQSGNRTALLKMIKSNIGLVWL